MNKEELAAFAEIAAHSPLTAAECACGHPSCNQSILSWQGGVGFLPKQTATILAAVNYLPEASRLLERAEKAEAALREIMELPGELNLSNYDHGDVEILNQTYIDTYEIAARALLDPSREGEGK